MPYLKATVKSKSSRKTKDESNSSSTSTSVSLKPYESSGNVFKDMGKNNEESSNLMMRSFLMLAIEDIIKERGLTHAEAAKIIGIARPRITELCSSRIDLFSLDTLIRYLQRLGKRVTISIRDDDEVA